MIAFSIQLHSLFTNLIAIFHKCVRFQNRCLYTHRRVDLNSRIRDPNTITLAVMVHIAGAIVHTTSIKHCRSWGNRWTATFRTILTILCLYSGGLTCPGQAQPGQLLAGLILHLTPGIRHDINAFTLSLW